MIDRVEKKDCAGCGACAAVCPKKAISLQENEDGFRFPVTDGSLCVQCGRCEAACPVLERTDRKAPLAVYAAAAGKERVLMQSASGGAFSALAEDFLREGGIVYGCAMVFGSPRGQAVSLQHVRVSEKRELAALSGSKYAQSRTDTVYPQVRRDLLEGRKVLFSGTPCQCAGLRQYLLAEKTAAEHLYTADILCHGVPAEKMFRQYLDYLGRKYRGTVTAYQFRDKQRGFTYFPRFRLKNKDRERWVLLATMEEGYWYLFQNSLANRESCYSCPYASAERCGDISLGDYWGIEQAHPELLTSGGGPLQREKGISLLLVNTAQGKKLLDTYGQGLQCCPSTLDAALVRGDALKKPSAMPPERDEVLRLLREKGYEGALAWVKRAMGAGYLKSLMKEKAKAVLRSRRGG